MTTSGGGHPSRIRRQAEPQRGKLLEPETHPRSGLSMTILTREEDETLSMFRLSVGRFLDRHATPAHLEQWRKAGVVDAGFWRLAGEAGILSPSVPEEYGGAGTDFRFELAVIEEIGRRGLEGFGAPVHSGIVTPYLVHFASEEQKRAWLPKVVSGEIVLAVAMTEPGAGSDLKSIRTRAVRDGDHYLIDGQKTFISNGQMANLIIVACKTGDKGLSLFAVETAGAKGFHRGRNLVKVGREAQDTSELFFEDVHVPAANLLGEVEGQGFAQLTSLLVQERIVIATMAQMMMERAVDLTIEYTKERRAFGNRLFDFQNTQFKLADCRTQATVGRTFLNDAVARHLAGTLDATTAAMVKLWICETEFRVIDECLQLFGGFGYMDDFPISRLFRDARIDRIHGGTSEIMKMIIARSL
jgi:acyl-CoA dehydrogenase